MLRHEQLPYKEWKDTVHTVRYLLKRFESPSWCQLFCQICDLEVSLQQNVLIYCQLQSSIKPTQLHCCQVTASLDSPQKYPMTVGFRKIFAYDQATVFKFEYLSQLLKNKLAFQEDLLWQICIVQS
jgi:hypothetical protein